MKTDKQELLEFIERLPDELSAESIITELQFRLTVLRRGADAEAGRNVVSHDEAVKRLDTWLNSSGT